MLESVGLPVPEELTVAVSAKDRELVAEPQPVTEGEAEGDGEPDGEPVVEGLADVEKLAATLREAEGEAKGVRLTVLDPQALRE